MLFDLKHVADSQSTRKQNKEVQRDDREKTRRKQVQRDDTRENSQEEKLLLTSGSKCWLNGSPAHPREDTGP